MCNIVSSGYSTLEDVVVFLYINSRSRYEFNELIHKVYALSYVLIDDVVQAYEEHIISLIETFLKLVSKLFQQGRKDKRKDVHLCSPMTCGMSMTVYLKKIQYTTLPGNEYIKLIAHDLSMNWFFLIVSLCYLSLSMLVIIICL